MNEVPRYAPHGRTGMDIVSSGGGEGTFVSDTAFTALESENAELRRRLAEMTADRNLWRDEHNEDCPNLTTEVVAPFTEIRWDTQAAKDRTEPTC